MMNMEIKPATIEDAAAILALQRLAYQSEAALYDDFTIRPLTETLEDMRARFLDRQFLKAVEDGQIVGSLRAYQDGMTCHLERLVVHPDYRRQGIGTALLNQIEMLFPTAERFELFTGHKSESNIRLYERMGNRAFGEEQVNEKVILIVMEKLIRQMQNEELEPKWLRWSRQFMAIAQNGLTFAKDHFDIERYEQVRRLAAEMMAEQSDTDCRKVVDLFSGEVGYATPKVDVRGVVFRENQILLVKERADGLWTLPGGWADVNESPAEAVVREVRGGIRLPHAGQKAAGRLGSSETPAYAALPVPHLQDFHSLRIDRRRSCDKPRNGTSRILS